MGVLYVTEPGALVGRKRERLQVRKGGVLLAHPRIDETEVAALVESVHLSPRAAQSLVRAGAEVQFITARGETLGRIGAAAARRFDTRHAQARLARDAGRTADLFRRLTAGRLAHQRAMLEDIPAEARTDETARRLMQMRLCAERLPQAEDQAAVQALASQADAAYRAVLDERIRASGNGFHLGDPGGPPSQADTLLALGHGLLSRWVYGLLATSGLDPAAPPLTLVEALVHALRPPIVDALVVSVLHRRTVRLGDFAAVEPTASPVEDTWAGAPAAPMPRLDREATRRFIVAYERKLQETVWYAPQVRHLTRRQIVQAQVYRLAAHVRGDTPYVSDAPPLWQVELPDPPSPAPTLAAPAPPSLTTGAPPAVAAGRMRLHVTEQGAMILRRHDCIEVRHGDTVLASPRVSELEVVALFGMVHLNAHARTALLRAGVEIVMLTRAGEFVGRYSADDAPRRHNWARQLERADDADYLLDTARRLVAGKIRNQRTLLMRRDPRSDKLVKALVAMRMCVERLDTAPDLDTVRGLEGAAAAAYFGVFGELIKAEGIEFPGRIRRPPPDPTNILLSFGYTLLTRLMHGALEVGNLDPYAGVLHSPVDNRVSLALDLIEELRPVVVDSLVIALLNRRVIRATDFTPVDDEVSPVEDAWEREASESNPEAPPPRRKLILSQDAARRFLVAYDRRLNDEVWYAPLQRKLTYRALVFEQVERMRHHLWGETPYEAYTIDF